MNGRFLDLTVKTRESEAALEPHVRRVFARAAPPGQGRRRACASRRTTPAAAGGARRRGAPRGSPGAARRLSRRSIRSTQRLTARDILAVPQVVTVESADGRVRARRRSPPSRPWRETRPRALVAMREAEGAGHRRRPLAADRFPPRGRRRSSRAGGTRSRRKLAATLQERVRNALRRRRPRSRPARAGGGSGRGPRGRGRGAAAPARPPRPVRRPPRETAARPSARGSTSSRRRSCGSSTPSAPRAATWPRRARCSR